MTGLITVVIITMVVAALVLFAVVLELPPFNRPTNNSNLKNLQGGNKNSRNKDYLEDQPRGTAESFAKAGELSRRTSFSTSKNTLSKRLRYAQWKMTSGVYRIITVIISLCFVIPSLYFFDFFFWAIMATSGPIIMSLLLQRAIDRRFNDFDKDYPPFLLSLVGLLKTGMNPMTAIESASKGMDPLSLIKLEIDLMLERMRYGTSEELSIGSFGEDINHSEIELFVQSLLLSRAVGGVLSDTLDRLARQSRKRQHFRNSAKAAVAMQRGSVGIIIVIMGILGVYLWFVFPEAVDSAVKDPTGWSLIQLGFIFVLAGIYWVGQVTKIKL
jgi:tight adherence protein B